MMKTARFAHPVAPAPVPAPVPASVAAEAPLLEMLTVIPARGGSKGLPRKNITELAGKQLIAYTIEAARKARARNKIVVSTDDPEIAEVAQAYGAEVPFLRPQTLATADANLGEALQYTVDRMCAEGYRAEAVLYLLPTSPFRNTRLVNTMVGKLTAGHQTVITVKKISPGRQLFYAPDHAGGLGHQTGILANKSCACFKPYGVFSGHRIGPAPRGNFTFTIEDPAMLIDIDSHNDLLLAEMVIANNLFDFEAC